MHIKVKTAGDLLTAGTVRRGVDKFLEIFHDALRARKNRRELRKDVCPLQGTLKFAFVN